MELPFLLDLPRYKQMTMNVRKVWLVYITCSQWDHCCHINLLPKILLLDDATVCAIENLSGNGNDLKHQRYFGLRVWHWIQKFHRYDNLEPNLSKCIWQSPQQNSYFKFFIPIRLYAVHYIQSFLVAGNILATCTCHMLWSRQVHSVITAIWSGFSIFSMVSSSNSRAWKLVYISKWNVVLLVLTSWFW